jgi:YesN/AraC family two-component response regulator
MPQFTVDEDLARLVETLAKPKPFENLSFNNALRRVLEDLLKNQSKPRKEGFEELDKLLAESRATTVPELKNKKNLTTWKAICDFLKINTAGDSARRKLRNWVKENKSDWPEVPGIDGD